jgi:hypothetical protein
LNDSSQGGVISGIAGMGQAHRQFTP